MDDTRAHLEGVLLDTLLPIVDEVTARLEAELSERDMLAVETAVRKAAAEGVRLAALEVAAQAQQDGGMLTVDLDVEPADAWAERYGR